jgi:putative transcription factor
VGLDVGRLIQQARNELKMTQKDLAQRLNEKPQVVNDYEAGRAIPNPGVLSKMERILGVRLRGAHKGEKFAVGKPHADAAGSAGK